MRLRRRFERDFDHVTDIEAGRTEHAHLQNKPTLRAARGRQRAEGSLAAIASKHWDAHRAAKRLHDMRRHDHAAQDTDLPDASSECVPLHLGLEFLPNYDSTKFISSISGFPEGTFRENGIHASSFIKAFGEQQA